MCSRVARSEAAPGLEAVSLNYNLAKLEAVVLLYVSCGLAGSEAA